jgi:uncharacterized protein
LIMTADMPRQLGGLEALLRSAGEKAGLPPVELWNPPNCGDIGLKIARDGQWFYQGSFIQRPALVSLFARVLRRDEDGQHYLVTPVEKVVVEVEDAPFLAVELERRGSGPNQTVLFRTNVDDVVVCGPDHPLRFEIEPGTQGLKPYVRVRGRLDALVSRSLSYDLIELLVDAPAGLEAARGLWSNGCFFAVPTASQLPTNPLIFNVY